MNIFAYNRKGLRRQKWTRDNEKKKERKIDKE